MNIWEFSTYRKYLMEKLGKAGSRTGLRKKLAEAIPVHTTFVSQVLKGRAEFSLEQAEGINTFFNHTDDESEYFILLLLKERAGSEKLKDRFERKIQTMREERLNIKKRLDVSSEISQEDRERFYSSYFYGAIHILVAISKFKTVAALTEALKLQRAKVQDIVEFMLKIGVLKEEKGQLSAGSRHVHLGNESELILRHHTNWRLHTISNLQFLDPDDLHYSACLSLSQKDSFRVKESILQNLKDNVDIISASPEEVAYVMSFDFYKLS
ncbi:MAG: DUF4423 domain-containing protein [Bdellovibrionales bacterium]|nr:DUF4423 domain-containing protein [Bdellovibrionales bacterium]